MLVLTLYYILTFIHTLVTKQVAREFPRCKVSKQRYEMQVFIDRILATY